MKKIKKLFKKLKEKASVMWTTVAGTMILAETRVFADSNTQSIDSFINFACDWLTKIGGVIALVGGVMFALGWQREDAEGKSRGLMTLMAGFMLVAIAQSKNIFGL
jgi:purine-cytosine permease-like protein